MTDVKWSKNEKVVAKRAVEAAYERECREVINEARRMANEASNPQDIWRLHDFLSEKRDELDYKYDYRYSRLLVVFARLIREGWMQLADLEGLREDKLNKIKQLLYWTSP